jgi:hypothetical protein
MKAEWSKPYNNGYGGKTESLELVIDKHHYFFELTKDDTDDSYRVNLTIDGNYEGIYTDFSNKKNATECVERTIKLWSSKLWALLKNNE